MLSVAVRILALLGLAPLRSTGSVLTCRASGGPKGGTVEFTLSDGNRLAKIGGSFPYTKELAPGEEEARGRRGDFRGGADTTGEIRFTSVRPRRKQKRSD